MERERERQAERSKSQRAVREREITMAISFMVNELSSAESLLTQH